MENGATISIRTQNGMQSDMKKFDRNGWLTILATGTALLIVSAVPTRAAADGPVTDGPAAQDSALVKVGDTLHAANGPQRRDYHVHMSPTDCATFRNSNPRFAQAPCDFNVSITLGTPTHMSSSRAKVLLRGVWNFHPLDAHIARAASFRGQGGSHR